AVISLPPYFRRKRLRLRLRRVPMRWRLLVITSFAAAVVACGLWSTLAIALFGSARELVRHDWFSFASAAVPLVFIIYAGVFAYRHTARRRKTQAMITAILAL